VEAIMNLCDVMQRDVKVIVETATVREAARLMKEHDVGALPVCDGETIKGVVTDRDIVVRAIAAAADPNEARVADAMTRDVVWCYEDDSVEDAARTMNERQIRRLLVLSRDKKLVGILSLADLVSAHGEAETREGVTEPAHVEH
jgi:CBS domain-containing protein